MHNVTLRQLMNLRTIANPVLSAAEWQLYSSIDGAETVAGELNAMFGNTVNCSKNRAEVRAIVEETMDKYSQFGTTDTEPRGVLCDMLDEVFGKM